MKDDSETRAESGVALLFVILLTSVLLLVSLGIANISYKQIAFSLEARDSDSAFFAADTGIECALYLDKNGHFGGIPTTAAECNGSPLYILSSSTVYTFVIPLDTTCAQVSVDKAFDLEGTGMFDYTLISAVGYNVTADPLVPTACVSGAVGPRVVTRGIRTAFKTVGDVTADPGPGTTEDPGPGTTEDPGPQPDTGGWRPPTIPPPTDTRFKVGTTPPVKDTESDGYFIGGNISGSDGGPVLTEGVDYGLTTAYGGTYSTPGSAMSFSFPAAFVDPCLVATYHYRAWATTAIDTYYGPDATLDWGGC